ncbi:FHA domain-containing protein PS1 isoform X2 [Corylus avellana]|uniref:FHA domain-containing protein PS1 isoform X2 n=1 Tax=Corylus avellana TaxID=13451 RepID=UPI00286B480A|nr:FHA domain-containing protein PS1 isoform X2 [Corylus avellana]
MADKKESIPYGEEETKIPVFTVLKNGAILKNIFIVNNHPCPPPPPSPPSISQNPDQAHEEILTVGRHPDCNITLTHPSISRFHLQIHSNPSKQHLSVVDLSSVHGTWVSGKKAEPGMPVELKEGDTVRVGGSSRVYRLHWVPLSCAYDLENPFVPPTLDVCMMEKKEEENALETYQDENSFSVENREIQSQDLILEGKQFMFSPENWELIVKKEIPSAPPLPENMIYDEKEEDESLSRTVLEPREISSLRSGVGPVTKLVDLSLPVGGVILETENQQLKKENWSPKPHSVMEVLSETDNSESSLRISEQEFKLLVNMDSSFSVHEEEATHPAAEIPEETENNILLEKDHRQRVVSRPWSGPLMTENSLLPVEEVPAETNNQQVDEGSHTPQTLLALQSLFDRGKEDYCTPEKEINLLVSLDSACSDEKSHSRAELLEEVERQSESSNDLERGEISSLYSVPITTESMDPSLLVGEVLVTVLPEVTEKKESQSQQFAFAAAGLSQIELSERSSPESEEKNLLMSLDSPCSDEKSHSGAELLEEAEHHSESSNGLEEREFSSFYSVPITTESMDPSLLAGEVLSEVTDNKESQTQQFAFDAAGLSEIELSERSSPGLEEINLLMSLDSPCSNEKSHSGAELLEEAEHHSESSNDLKEGEISSLYSVPITTESMDPSLLAGEVLVTVLPEVTDNKESQTQQFAFAAAGLSEIEFSERSSPGSEEKLESCSIWSRRGKPASVPLIQTGASRGVGVDAEVGSHNWEDTENKLIAKALFTDLQEEEEIFTPNKENFTPNTLLVKSLKMKGRTGEIKHSKSWLSSSSKITFSPGSHPEEAMTASSDKESLTPKLFHEQESARPTYGNRVGLEQERMPIKRISERVPFQSLLVNSTGKSRADASVPDAAMRSCNSFTCTQTKANNSTGEAKRSWNMVVDTTTLLNKESRKSLLLLQGLKGTHLIIPRMVLRELDTLKRRGSLFRRTTEASLVLEWIEECMVKTKGWIHVQSSFEEDRALAPTPPAFPQSSYSEASVGSSYGTTSSMPFSSYGSLTEIVSPTAEDHILDYALLYRRMKNDGRLILLSDDVTMKIKAMAEGLICETAQEFRESLVNPFSERFLWADSSPRGFTWSYLDDVVLREQYSRRPFKKSAKGDSAKGLKLILLHNFHYGHISSVS